MIEFCCYYKNTLQQYCVLADWTKNMILAIFFIKALMKAHYSLNRIEMNLYFRKPKPAHGSTLG